MALSSFTRSLLLPALLLAFPLLVLARAKQAADPTDFAAPNDFAAPTVSTASAAPPGFRDCPARAEGRFSGCIPKTQSRPAGYLKRPTPLELKCLKRGMKRTNNCFVGNERTCDIRRRLGLRNPTNTETDTLGFPYCPAPSPSSSLTTPRARLSRARPASVQSVDLTYAVRSGSSCLNAVATCEKDCLGCTHYSICLNGCDDGYC